MPRGWSQLICASLDSRPRLELPKRLSFPVLPQSVVEFSQIAANPEAGPHELAAPLESDPTLTSALLRQINSTAMGLKQKVASVAQAIGLFGPRRTKTLVLTSALQTATKDMKSRLIHMAEFHRENRIRALFAREAAQAIHVDAETAYVSGLLQDLLLPMLSEAFYSDYVQILGKEWELVEQERERFGWDHASVAARLIQEWGFPEELVAGVLFHHDVDRVILDETLRQTSVAAAMIAGCLPDSLNQSRSGFDALLVMQDALPEFCALEVACAVDDECALQGQAANLSDHLAELAVASLEQRRFDRVHWYRKVGNYTLEGQIGEGGMGVVYRAKHCVLKRPAAIKLLHSAKISSDLLSRFESEAQLTCGLTSPHTVAVYDYGVTSEGLCYYVMEYLDGITLAELVKMYGPLPPSRAIHFLKQACLSLAEAHSAGLIHGDIKPENLMVCSRGGIPDTLKVLDFGLARSVSNRLERSQASRSLSGTPRYMPPEAFLDGQSTDARSDLYSLGAVAYFLLTGEPVFPGTDLKSILTAHARHIPRQPSVRLGAPIDRDLEQVVMQCLAKAKQDRPASAQRLHQQLSRCRAGMTWTTANAEDWWAQREHRPVPELSKSAVENHLEKTWVTDLAEIT
jgi:HD-like signal output (HDOD) protein